MRCRLGRAATGYFGGQVGHPCIPALCRFRQGWQYRVLCRSLRCCLSFCPGLRRPLCRPGFPSARSVPLPAMWGSTGFSAGLVVLPAILPGLAAPIMPPGRVAFFPGKSSLIFRQTRKLYTGSLRNCLPALNRLFFCMSHSLLCDELLHTHLV